jgi:hypothetical protein
LFADVAQGASLGSELAHFDTAAQHAGTSFIIPLSSSAAVEASSPQGVSGQVQQPQRHHAGVCQAASSYLPELLLLIVPNAPVFALGMA